MAEKFAFDYVNEIFGIVNYAREALCPACTIGAARAASRSHHREQQPDDWPAHRSPVTALRDRARPRR